jgi:hypothetical protein
MATADEAPRRKISGKMQCALTHRNLVFAPAYSVASSQLTGHSVSAFVSPLAFLALEIAALMVALLSGVMYSVSTRRGWQIALWGAAIVLLLQFALAVSSFFFIPLPGLPPAAALIFLAAMFSLGVRETTRDADVERQPLSQPSSTLAPRSIQRLILGALVALLGGAAYIFLLPVSWVAFLGALAASSIGATLLIRSPVSALVVPVGAWLGAVTANIIYGAVNARLADPIFWGGMLEFAGILIVIAVIPALIGVAIGALLTRWLPATSA